MMQVIRDKAQGIIAWVIVAIVAFVLCFWGVSGYISKGDSKVLAKVDSKNITQAEVNDVYNRWLRLNSTQKDFDASQVDPELIKQQITTAMVQQIAVTTGIIKEGFIVSDAMVVEAIRNKPELQQDGKFSIEIYKQLLAQLSIDERAFESMVREELLFNQLQIAVLATSFASEQEAQKLITLKNQKRDFGYAIIPATKYATAIAVTDSEIEDFYNKNKQQFITPDKVQLEYLELSLDQLLQQVTVTEQDLKAYYEANLTAFTDPRSIQVRHIMMVAPKSASAAETAAAKKKIEDVYAQLQQGGDFVVLAKKYSEDKQTAVQGGDLGWISESDQFPSQVYMLKNNGDYTTPLQSDYGWHVFQIVATKGGVTKSFNQVKSIVKERYVRDAAERLLRTKGDELSTLAFENPTSLTVASEKLSLPIKTTAYFSRAGGTGIAESPNVVKDAFSEDVFKNGRNSELIRLSDDIYVVVRVKDKQVAHEQELTVVRADIIRKLQQEAATTKTKQVGEDLLVAIKKSNAPNKAASNMQLQWVMKRGIERDNKDIDKKILVRAFGIAKPENGQAFSLGGFALSNGDYLVVAVTSVKNEAFNNNEDSNLLEMLAQQIAGLSGKIEFASLQTALVEQAKIKLMTQ